MPSHKTFRMRPVDTFIREHLIEGITLDPFANRPSDYGAITNDLNPESETDYNLDALEFLKGFMDGAVQNVLFDPPYSLRQVKECYDGIGHALTLHQTRHFFSDLRDEISRVLAPGGVCISFGWSTVGMGKKRGFSKTDILLISHGGIHNDTLVLKEVKNV